MGKTVQTQIIFPAIIEGTEEHKIKNINHQRQGTQCIIEYPELQGWGQSSGHSLYAVLSVHWMFCVVCIDSVSIKPITVRYDGWLSE